MLRSLVRLVGVSSRSQLRFFTKFQSNNNSVLCQQYSFHSNFSAAAWSVRLFSSTKLDSPILEKIDEQVKGADVVVYMKGTPDQPMCGFSKAMVTFLQSGGVPFSSYNVLEDEELRQGVKDYADWPTVPQLYVRGEFIGGLDICVEMAEKGELQKLLEDFIGKAK